MASSESEYCFLEKPISETEREENFFTVEIPILRKILSNVLKKYSTEEEILEWIEVYVGNKSSDPLFLYALTQALIECLFTGTDEHTMDSDQRFEYKQQKTTILRKFVGYPHKVNLEMKVILAIQRYCVETQHPPGLLFDCFNTVFDAEIVRDSTFLKWETTDDPDFLLGKDVCLSAVESFLCWLKMTC